MWYTIILLTNHTKIYEYLSEGNLNDIFCNIYLDIQKYDSGTFKSKTVRHYQNIFWNVLVDSIRHYDIPKKNLGPYESDTLQINLLDVARGFEAGHYRCKAFLRVGSIRNNEPYDDPLFEKPLPEEDKIIYCTSRWIEFTVIGYQMKPLNPL